MNNIILNTQYQKWFSMNGIHGVGFAFLDGDLLCEKELFSVIRKAIDDQTLISILKRLNGNCSLIIEAGDTCYIIADKMRSFPVLYSKIANGWVITNDAVNIITYPGICEKIDFTSVLEFLAAGYLFGEKTLLQGVKQVAAGTCVCLKEYSSEVIEYHNYMLPKVVQEESEILTGAKDVLDRAFKRMFESIGDRQIVIPLSGGYDSRLIACICKKLQRQNVVCYSYGRSDSFEVEVSKAVAAQLGYKWFFVEYTPALFDAMKKDTDFFNYLDHSHNLNTLPHFQDYFAVKELCKRGVFEANAVFVPGHSGDLFGGSKLPMEVFATDFSPNPQNLAKLIYEHFFDLNKEKYNDLDKCIQLIYDQLKECHIDSLESILNIYEPYWFVKSKVAHFLVNSMRIYEHFGFDWRLPLWDDEYATFWYKVEWEKKMNSELYNRFMFDTYFTPLKVAYKKNNTTKQLVPSGVKKFIPFPVLRLGRSAYMRLHKRKYDFNAQSHMIDLFKEMNNRRDEYSMDKSYDINSIAVIYILNRIICMLKN